MNKSKPKAYNFVTKLLPAKPDSEWEALLEESNGRCRVAEEHRKAEQHHAAYLIKRLADIQYLKIEDRDRGRSQRADELFQLINDNHDTRDATETVIGLVKEYWKLEKEYKNQIRAREEVATEGAISISKLEKERLDLKDDKARAASRFEQERTRLREERSRLELDNLRLRGDLDSMRKQCDSRIAETVEAHKNEMVEERRRHREAKEKIEASHKERMRELKCEHEEAILNLTEKTAQVQRTMTFDRQKIENKHVEDLQEWETRYTTKIVQMEKSAKDSQSVLERRHAAQEASLRSDITSLNKALLAREAFDPPTDHDLTAPFEDFLIDLDQLVAKASKLWQPQDLGWTDNLLARLAPQNQQKTIRRQIIQDSVWVILNKNIFCSPFRVFGEEGERLEVEWKDGYREESREEKGSFKWPAPSMDSERWRYDTMKPLHDALKKPASKHDARAKIKQGFETTLNNIQEELLEMLKRVARLDQTALTKWDNIPKRAAEVWIAMGTQRCRLRVIIPGGELTDQADRARKAKEEGLQLVISPELRRYGDPRGQDLGKEPESMVKGEVKLVPEAT